VKVLIVDDSTAMRMLVKRTLKQAGFDGLDIVEAADGALALDLMDDEAPELILCDWNMPNMSGMEFLEALRESGNVAKFGFVTTESTAEMRAGRVMRALRFSSLNPSRRNRLRRRCAPLLDNEHNGRLCTSKR